MEETTRKLASIAKIEEVLPIEGADCIEKVRVKEWWCVTKKGEFKEGESCVYFEIDSLLPQIEPFNFLEKNGTKKVVIDNKEYIGYRLRTIKLRGQISQGLCVPLVALTLFSKEPLDQFDVGEDVTELLGIVKYEQPIPASLSGEVRGFFPSFIPKTDEERVQNIPDVISRSKGKIFYITEKVDGSSCTIFKKDGELRVCSRNLELKENEKNTIWRLAKKYELDKLLKEDEVIQGEIVGEGIQKNPLKIKGQELYVFNVFSIRNQKYMNFDVVKEYCNLLKLKIVPIINEQYILKKDVQGLLNLAEGKSLIATDVEREGIVLRPLVEKIESYDGIEKRFSFKVINNNYLLKHDM